MSLGLPQSCLQTLRSPLRSLHRVDAHCYLRCEAPDSKNMAKVKKGVKKFQKRIAGGGVHKKKKLHFRRDKADAAKAAEAQVQSAAVQQKKAGSFFLLDTSLYHPIPTANLTAPIEAIAVLACFSPESLTRAT